MESSTFDLIRTLVAAGDVRFSDHGYDQLAEDDIAARALIDSVANAEVVEDYPDFGKGPAVLVLQRDTDKRPIHAVWGIPKGYTSPAVLVTAYRPNPLRWNETFTQRRK